MKKLVFAVVLAVASSATVAAGGGEWPVARHFDGDHLLRVALPMGGIGCGSVSLSGRGDLVDWEIMNRANKNYFNRSAGSRPFFAIRVKGAGHESATMLAGPIHPAELYFAHGCNVPQCGLPRFAEASFDGAFPFGTVHLSDKGLPVKVDIKGFSPFVPGNSADSSLPVASLEYEVENMTGEPLEVSICAYVRNIAGCDGRNDSPPAGNTTTYREGEGVRGLVFKSEKLNKNSPAWGPLRFRRRMPTASSRTAPRACPTTGSAPRLSSGTTFRPTVSFPRQTRPRRFRTAASA